jgi:hypothetical protein
MTIQIPWNTLHVDQLERHQTIHLRPRFDALSDEEYLWEPVPGCWNVLRENECYSASLISQMTSPLVTPVPTSAVRPVMVPAL